MLANNWLTPAVVEIIFESSLINMEYLRKSLYEITSKKSNGKTLNSRGHVECTDNFPLVSRKLFRLHFEILSHLKIWVIYMYSPRAYCRPLLEDTQQEHMHVW